VKAECAFRVVAEEEGWIAVDKPAPLAVHPANARREPTLLDGLRQLLAYEIANGARLSILTRLDRETSGLVLVAKQAEAARELSRQLAARRVGKEYLAIVHGWPEWGRRRCEGPILRAGEVGPSEIWLRRRVHPAGRPCATAFEVGGRWSDALGRFAWLRCLPEGGRTHQIRVHLERLGHPLVGDKIYGGDGRAYLEQVAGRLSDESVARLILPRQALHASRLVFECGGRRHELRSPWPPDLARFLAAAALGEGHGEPR